MSYDEHKRLIALFGYESGEGRNSILWSDPWYFAKPVGQGGKQLDEDLTEWKATKRPFTKEGDTRGYMAQG